MNNHKKIFKDSKNGKVLGVCAGLSEYLGIDVSIIRILWLLMIFAYGSGILLYFICGIILPDRGNFDNNF